jgi:hypothetical protein
MDPKANWLFGPALGDYLAPLGDTDSEGRLIPFLMQFGDQDSVEAFGNIIEYYEQDRATQSPIFLPPIYRNSLVDPDPERPGPVIVAIAIKAFFDKLGTRLEEKKDPDQIDGEFERLRLAQKQVRLSEPLQTEALAQWNAGKPIPIFGVTHEFPSVSIPPRDEDWPEGTVIMSVIDDGMAIANERFRERHPDGPPKPDASRVQFLWCMPTLDPADSPVTIPAGFGKEFAKQDPTIPGQKGIDSYLGDSSTDGVIDEDHFYRLSGLVDMAQPVRQQATARRASHGAHVLDLTAGEDPGDPAGRTRGALRPIIGVQLPVSTVEDTSGALLEAQLVLAVDYILERADALARSEPSAHSVAQLPVVVNCSYGFIAGPHDGKSALERALDRRVRDRAGKLRIVLPAGNSNLSRCHASFNLPGEYQELRWRVQPDDRTLSYVEIWLPEGFDPASRSGRVALSVETPSGVASLDAGMLEEGAQEILVLKDGSDAVLALAGYVFRQPEVGDPRTRGRGMFCVILQPTARLQPTSDPTAASGVWTIRVHNQSFPEDERIHAWIQRDDTPFGYPVRGRQSYFDEFCYQRFSETKTPIGETIAEDAHQDQGQCHVERAGLTNAIATGTETIVVGGYVKERKVRGDGGTVGIEAELADYSAGGRPSEDEPIRGPDISAISDDSRFHIGVLATGTRSNSKIALNGTSVAAPKIARLIAEHVSGRTLPADICSLEPRVSLTPPNPVERAGCGGVQDEKIEGLPVNEHERFERDII